MVHAFICLDRRFALDGESGALLELDEAAYDVIGLWARGAAPDAIRAALEGSYGAEALDEIIGDVAGLVDAGQIFVPDAPDAAAGGGRPLKAMCLHVAHDCDLRCRYCFAGTGSFSADRSLMSFEVGKRALDFLVTRSGPRRLLEVDFFGGEPLLNWPVVRGLVAYGRDIGRASGKEIAFTLTTNGTHLTREISDALNREMVNLVLSIDGRPEVHDAMRPRADGSGTHAEVLPKFLDLVASRGGKAWYARGTFTRRNLDFAADVAYLYGAGLKQISVEPAVLPGTSPLSLREEDLPSILDEYERLARAAVDRPDLTFFHFMVDLERGPCIKKRLSGCGAGCEYVAVTPEGDIFPCHQFVGRGEYRMGSVIDGTLDEGIVGAFSGAHVLDKPDCAACWARLYCSGGCAANAQAYSGDIMRPNPMECAMQRKRLECALALHAVRRESEAPIGARAGIPSAGDRDERGRAP